MLDAAVKALAQMVSPPFRAVLLKSIGAALALLIVLVIALHRLLSWLASSGGGWIEITIGPGAHTPVNVLLWIVAIIAGLGLIAGAVFLMPAVTALVASLFGDEIAEQVERFHYPADPPGAAVPIARSMMEGVKIALLSVAVYLAALPFLLVAGLGVIVFFFATAYLQGRQYFELVAMRFHPAAEAKALRKTHRGTVFTAGMLIAAFVSVPVINLATPLFGTAFMVHLYKRLAAVRRELIEPRR